MEGLIFTEADKSDYKPAPTITMPRDEYKKRLKIAYMEGQREITNTSMQELRQEGKEEAIKTHTKEKEENRQRVQSIIARNDIEIMHAYSVFPFTFFTDTLIIDTTKMSISKKQFFATEFITTIPLKDLSDVNVQTFLFLATLNILYMPQSASPGMNSPIEVKIPNLPRSDAIKAKNILKGVLVAKAEEIDIAKLPPEEVVEVLNTFGQSNII